MTPLKPKSARADHEIAVVVSMLKKSRDILRAHDCPKTLARVRLAITSAEGAQRHIQRRPVL